VTRSTLARSAARLAGMALFAAAVPIRASAQVMDNHTYSLVLFDLLEYQRTGGANPVAWDMLGWVGGDFTRFWIKSEGAQSTVGSGGEAELQGLYSRLVAPFWEVQAGLRVDTRYGPGPDHTRVLAVVGLEGIAPYWFELEPAVFVSQRGDISARITGSYDLFLTQRLLLQPRVEMNAAVQRVAEFGVGSGLNDLDLGLRLRYEIRREWAPYLGVRWARRFAGTAELARLAGEEATESSLVGGIRVWF
jgi:copper resistance protein B